MLKRKYLLGAVVSLALLAAMLPGCSARQAAGGPGSASQPAASSAAAAGSSNSSAQGNAAAIEQMLKGIQSDSAQISDGEAATDSTDSTIGSLGTMLGGSQDDVSGVNQ